MIHFLLLVTLSWLYFSTLCSGSDSVIYERPRSVCSSPDDPYSEIDETFTPSNTGESLLVVCTSQPKP